jgi:peroxiredoxin
VDIEEGAAFLGASARERSQALAAQHAPDFSLPDLDGRLHTLREHRGKKILLVAWASW